MMEPRPARASGKTWQHGWGLVREANRKSGIKPGPNSPDDSTFHKEVLSRRTRADNRSGAVSRFRRGSPATTPSAMLADELRGRACSPAYCLMATATA